MKGCLYIVCRIVLVLSIVIWLGGFASLFGFDIPHPPSYVLLISAVSFPFAVLSLLITTPEANKAVTLWKRLIGITFLGMVLSILYIFYIFSEQIPNIGAPSPGNGDVAIIGLLLVVFIAGGTLFLMLIELIALAIAELLTK
jgi:hypothetical protein